MIWGRSRRSGVAAQGADDWTSLGALLPHPPQPQDGDDLLWRELEAYLRFYDAAAWRARIWFQILKVIALLAGAAVTVLAAISAPAGLTASIGAAIVVLEGTQQLFQFHANWLSYRSAAEALRQHAFAYVAGVTPYDDLASRRQQLAAALSTIVSKEVGTWSTTMLATPATGDAATH